MQPQMGIWKRFIRSLLRVDRCSLCWGSGRGLFEDLLGRLMQPQMGMWKRFIRNLFGGGQMQPLLGIWKRFIRSLSGVDRFSVS